MPSFISIDGEWKAAKEKAVNIHTAEIYEGPDREAIKYIAKENGISIDEAIKANSHIGQLASDDPEMTEVAKKHGFATVAEYLKAKKATPAQQKEIDKARAQIVSHQPEKPKPGVDGGTKGGFYDQDKSDPISEFNKKS